MDPKLNKGVGMGRGARGVREGGGERSGLVGCTCAAPTNSNGLPQHRFRMRRVAARCLCAMAPSLCPLYHLCSPDLGSRGAPQKARQALLSELERVAVPIESIIDPKRPYVHMSLMGASDSCTWWWWASAPPTHPKRPGPPLDFCRPLQVA